MTSCEHCGALMSGAFDVRNVHDARRRQEFHGTHPVERCREVLSTKLQLAVAHVHELEAERTAAVDKWAIVSGELDASEAENARLRKALEECAGAEKRFSSIDSRSHRRTAAGNWAIEHACQALAEKTVSGTP